MEKELVLQIKNVSKSFGSTKALVDVSIDFYKGEIRGLIGENGSGKSTVSNVVMGVHTPDAGEIYYKGERFLAKSMIDANEHKIAMVTQEMGTINNISIAENLFLGREKHFSRGQYIDRKRMHQEAKKALAMVGLKELKPEAMIDYVSFEDRKLIEVARVLYDDPDVLFVDETTTALSQAGRDKMYEIMHKLKENKKTVVFISHDLEELMEHSDGVSVMRDGHYVKTVQRKDLDGDTLRTLMIGRELKGDYYRSDYEGRKSDEVVLEAEDICFEREVRHVSLKLHKGEILGIGGLTDCGMHELGKIIFGLQKPDKGHVTLPQKGRHVDGPGMAIRQGMAYLSKNRDQEALMLTATIKENICVAALDKLKQGVLLSPKREMKLAKEMTALMEVKMQNVNQHVMYLSGGNKQKVVIGKWLGNDSEILILDCPTRGIDIGVKASIYRLMEKLKAENKALIMISEELPELIGMSDRIIVMKNGSISGEFNRAGGVGEADVIKCMI